MLGNLIKKVFGTKHERDLKKINPIVDEINEIFPTLEKLSQEELISKTREFQKAASEVWKELDEETREAELEDKERKEKISNWANVWHSKRRREERTGS